MIFKKIGKYVMLLFSVIIIQALLLLIFAKAIEYSVFHFSSGPDLILVSIIVSIAAIGFIVISKSGDIKATIIIAVIYILIITMVSLMANGFRGNEGHYIKLLISILCGEIVGVLFGNHRFHRHVKRRVRNCK